MRFTIKPILFLSLFAALNLTVFGEPTITVQEIRASVEFLASAELEGREAGSRGAEIAARYIASCFKGMGLIEPEGAPGYYQEVPLIAMCPDFAHTAFVIQTVGKKFNFTVDKDVYFCPAGGNDADISASLVFAGFGITAPEYEYDDYDDIDADYKVVVIMTGEPGENDSTSVFEGTRRTKYSMLPVKIRIAREHGAAAVMVIRAPGENQPSIEETVARYRERLKKPIIQLQDRTEDLPVFYLTEEAVSKLMKADRNFAQVLTDFSQTGKIKTRSLEKMKAEISIRFRDKREFTSPNVCGYLPGGDEKLSDEVLIIGAHYDHEGKYDGEIYYGADDNASGVAALLELAEAFALADKRPKRSVLFISFAAEEKGLLGSQYYVSNPLYPLENTAAMINMDEIGRNGAATYAGVHSPKLEEKGENYLMVMYSAQTPELEEINRKINQKTGLDLDFDPNVRFYGSSDNASFHNAQIPVIFYFTGFHPDYSSPGDTPDKINYVKLERIAELIFGVSQRILEGKQNLKFNDSIKSVEKKQRMQF